MLDKQQFISELYAMRCFNPGKSLLITAYENPLDFPDKYVARLFLVDIDGEKKTDILYVADSFDTLKEAIPLDYYWLERHLRDEPQILGVWI